MGKNSSSSKQSADTTTTTTYTTDSSIHVDTGISGKDLSNLVATFGNILINQKTPTSNNFNDASSPYANSGFAPAASGASPAPSALSQYLPMGIVIGGIIAIIYVIRSK